MNDDDNCAQNYTAPMTDECKYAAWAPPSFLFNATKPNGDALIPQPIFNPDDSTRGPRWPSNGAFELLYGWTNMPHTGRIDWDAHTLNWEKDKPSDAGGPIADIRRKHAYQGYQRVAPGDNPSAFSGGHTLGPYPLRGKNDGLLEW